MFFSQKLADFLPGSEQLEKLSPKKIKFAAQQNQVAFDTSQHVGLRFLPLKFRSPNYILSTRADQLTSMLFCKISNFFSQSTYSANDKLFLTNW